MTLIVWRPKWAHSFPFCVPGAVGFAMFVSHLQSQDSVKTLEYILMEKKEQTGRGLWEAFVLDLSFNQLEELDILYGTDFTSLQKIEVHTSFVTPAL